MDEEKRNREDRNREEVPGRRETNREDENKNTVDKLIDKAQEKGLFDKAAKMARDKFGGGGKRR